MMNATDAIAVMRFLEKEAHDGEHTGEARRVLMDTAAYLGHRATSGVPTGVEAEVCDLIADRQRKGVAKYGMTVADNPLALRDWLQHALEEVLDQAVYLKRAINKLEVLQPLVVTQSSSNKMTLSSQGSIGQGGLTDIHYDIDQDDLVVLVKVSP